MIMFIIDIVDIIIVIDYIFNYLIFTYVPQVGRVSHRFGHFSRCAQTAGIKEITIDRETHHHICRPLSRSLAFILHYRSIYFYSMIFLSIILDKES